MSAGEWFVFEGEVEGGSEFERVCSGRFCLQC